MHQSKRGATLPLSAGCHCALGPSAQRDRSGGSALSQLPRQRVIRYGRGLQTDLDIDGNGAGGGDKHRIHVKLRQFGNVGSYGGGPQQHLLQCADVDWRTASVAGKKGCHSKRLDLSLGVIWSQREQMECTISDEVTQHSAKT